MAEKNRDVPVPVIYPKNSLLVGVLCVAAGLAASVGVIALEIPAISKHGIATFLINVVPPLLIAAMIISVGILVMVPKGGVYFLRQRKRLRLFSGFPSTIVDVQVGDIVRLYVFQRSEPIPEGVRQYYSIEAALKGGGYLMLAEAENYTMIVSIAREMEEILRIALVDLVYKRRDFPENEAQVSEQQGELDPFFFEQQGEQARYRWRIGVGGAYYLILGIIGLNALGLGAMLLLVMNASIAGVFFGPLMFLMGVALLLTVVEKGVAREVLIQNNRSLSHHSRFGALNWGRRQTTLAGEFRLRLAPAGVRGTALQVITDDRVFTVASGSTNASAIRPPQLIALLGAFKARINANIQD